MLNMDKDLADAILDLFATRTRIVEILKGLENAGRTNATSSPTE